MQQCQSCQKHPATVHQFEVSYSGDGSKQLTTLHLCAPCAKQRGISVAGNAPSYPAVVSFLSKALLGGKELAQTEKDRACPECGWTLRDFRQTSRFGCAHDYEFFEDFVNDVLERVHGTSEHPSQSHEAELARLTRKMNQAIGREEYEEAARLRDQIRGLENKMGLLENPETREP